MSASGVTMNARELVHKQGKQNQDDRTTEKLKTAADAERERHCGGVPITSANTPAFLEGCSFHVHNVQPNLDLTGNGRAGLHAGLLHAKTAQKEMRVL